MRHGRRSLSLLLLSSALGAAACLAPGTQVQAGPGGAVSIVGGTRVGWATKVVLTKQPPETLVADDGTVCRVAPDRYRETEPGSLIACPWNLGEPPVDSLDPGGAPR
jgi:hypothetical protein